MLTIRYPRHITSHHAYTSTITIPQIPQSSNNGEDSENALPCPPVNACTLSLSEPLDSFIDGVGVGNANRPVPSTSNISPPLSKLTTAPEILTPDAPALSVTPSPTTTTKEDCASIWKPSIVISEDEDEDEEGKVAWGGVEESGMMMVLEPRSRVPEGWRVRIVPFTVAAGPPAEMVVPAMGNAEGLGVNVWPATV